MQTAIRKQALMEQKIVLIIAGWGNLPMQHIHQTLIALRRHIAASESREELETVDSLLAVALEEVRRGLVSAPDAHRGINH